MLTRAEIRRKFFGTKRAAFLSTLGAYELGMVFPVWLYFTVSADLPLGFSLEVGGVMSLICGLGAVFTWAFFIEPLSRQYR